MSDAVVGVADDQLAPVTSRGMSVGEATSLVEGTAPYRGGPVGEVDLPVTVGVMLDADEGVRGA
jgi:hypothetical protein